MVNCNPETVSTDYDTADRLYFEPLTPRTVLEIVRRERTARAGRDRAVRRPDAAQAVKHALARCRACRSWAPRPTRSTWPRTASASPSSLDKLDLEAAAQRARRFSAEAEALAKVAAQDRLSGAAPPELRAGRPGDEDRARRSTAAQRYIREAVKCRAENAGADRPLPDRRHRGRCRCAVADGPDVHVGRHHGAHRGGGHPFRRLRRLLAAAGYSLSARRSSPRSMRQTVVAGQGAQGRRADERAVRGQGRNDVYVLEVNPRASRTVPFVAKATGVADRQGRRAHHGRAKRSPRSSSRSASSTMSRSRKRCSRSRASRARTCCSAPR